MQIILVNIILFLSLFAAIGSVLAADDCSEITNRKPIFQITFDEPSNITLFELKGSKGTVIPVSLPGMKTNLSTRFEASVEQLLDISDRKYILHFIAIDFFNNNVSEQRCYNLNPKPTIIKLIEPEFGVSSKKPFTVKLETDSFAKCKYSINKELPFEDPAFGMINDKEASYTFQHSIDIGESLFPDESTVVKLFVKCNRTDGDLQKAQFDLSIDTSPPEIKSIRTFPQSGSVISDPSLKTNLEVITDEPVRCRYSLSNKSSFSEMEYTFADFAQFKTSSTLFQNLVDRTAYNFNIICQNKAKLFSDIKTHFFEVNVAAGESITLNKPTSSLISKLPVAVELFTNKRASCSVTSDLGSPGVPFQSTDEFTHLLPNLPLAVEGSYNFTISCGFLQQGNEKLLTKQQTLPIIYDKTAPEITNFTYENTCIAEEISLQWLGKDLTEITGYQYLIKGDTTVLQNWTDTKDNYFRLYLGSLTGNNQSSVNKYEVSVRGIDIAGNTGAGTTYSSFKLSDPMTPECVEKTPPKSNITKKFEGNSALITITCTDVGSGCDRSSFKYGITESAAAACSPSQSYTAPVKLSKTSTFCWQVADYAKNTHSGQEHINLKDDTDEDGIPDSIDVCPDTPKTESADSTGCSPSQLDDDNDGIPNSLDQCPGSSQEAVDAQAIDATGCYLDTDNDGMPDYWEQKYGFKIDDPSDADENPDKDGATNLQEYLSGTNPLEADVDAGQISDTDGDGIPDTLDKCPATSPDSRVDKDGCSAEDLDSDSDGMSNECEQKYGLDPEDPNDAGLDLDKDGLTNLDECTYYGCELRLDPKNPDTDGDGYDDGKESEYGTSPCDSSDFPESKLLFFLLLSLGIISLLSGLGYLIYAHFIEKKQSDTFSALDYRDTTTDAQLHELPSQPQLRMSQSAVSAHQLPASKKSKKNLTKEQRHRILLEKIKKERKTKSEEKRGRLFSTFGSAEPESSDIKKLPVKNKPLHHIMHHAKKVSEMLKSAVLPHETVKEKLAPKMSEHHEKIKQLTASKSTVGRLKQFNSSASSDLSSLTKQKSNFDALKSLSGSSKLSLKDFTNKDIPMENLKDITLTKTDIQKLHGEGKAEKIFDTLSSLHKEKQEHKASAYSKLSELVKEKQFDSDIFSSLPQKLVPQNAQEAAAYSKLNKLLEGKNVTAADISNIKSEKKSIDYLKELAKKK